MLVNKDIIRDRNGKILGYVETHSNGDKIAKDFYNRIVARYHATSKLTKDFYGRILSKGDITAGILYKNS